MDELIRHFKNLEEDETLKRIDDAYNRGWNDAMNNPEVKKALERMKPKKVIPEKVYWAPKNRSAYFIRFLCPTCGGIADRATNREFCNKNGCGQRLDWSEE